MMGWNQLPYTSNNDILSEQKPAARIGMGFGVDFLPFPGVAIWIVQFEVKGFLQYLEVKKNDIRKFEVSSHTYALKLALSQEMWPSCGLHTMTRVTKAPPH